MSLNVYVILGSAGSGRRALLPNFVRDGLGEEELPAAILVWKGEQDHVPDSIPQFLANTHFATYDFVPPAKGAGLPAPPLPIPALPEATRTLFIVAPGSGDPRDFIEAFHSWLSASGHELARIIFNANCRLLHDHPAVSGWFECCAHFADVVLLNQRHDINNKWIRDYELSFAKKRMPLHVFFVKKDRVDRADIVLMPQARRLCLLFDPLEDLPELPVYTDKAPSKAVIDDDTEMNFDLDEEDDDNEGEQVFNDDEVAEDEWLSRDSKGIRRQTVPELPKS